MTTSPRDLIPDDTVWLIPRTRTAPAVCYQQPRGRVVRVEWPYIVINVNGTQHKVHKDNVRRNDPHQDQAPTSTRPNPRPMVLPAGWQDAPLW